MAKRKELEQPVARATGVKIVVISQFVDKFDKKTVYEPGEELEFDETRAKDVISRGLAEYQPAGNEGDNSGKSTKHENEQQNGEEK